jgi:peptidoglycan/xylan/chitin deacetylase (PgdA/CDA1 family)
VFFSAVVLSSASVFTTDAFAAIAPNTSAKVSFTFDDGLSSALIAGQTLQTYGYVGTDYIVTHCIGMIANSANNDCQASTTRSYMNWADISTLHTTYGWEIGSHTTNHVLTAALDNPGLSDAMLDSEMSQSQAILKANGYPALNFAAPYGDYDNRSIAVAAKYYSSHRAFQDLTFSTDPISNTFPYYNPRSSYPYNNYLLSVLPVQGNVSIATVKSYIDQAKANNQWLILVFHEIKADSDPTYDAAEDAYEYKAGDLSAIAAYVKAQSVPVVNISDGLASETNLMPNSTFNNGIADGWSTDSPNKILADVQTSALTGHGSFDGTTTGALKSILAKGSATDTHLLSPRVTVAPGITYTIKSFINLTSTSGEIDFYIDEYDSAGNDLGTGRYIQGITGTTNKNNVQVGNVNILYTPTSLNAASARVQVIVHGASVVAYIDNIEWLSPNGVTAPPPPVTPPPVVKVGDINSDGKIDIYDLSILSTNWQKTSGADASQGDLNSDGAVDIYDLSILSTNWGK